MIGFEGGALKSTDMTEQRTVVPGAPGEQEFIPRDNRPGKA